MISPDLRAALDGHFYKISDALVAISEMHRVAKERKVEHIHPITNAAVFTVLA